MKKEQDILDYRILLELKSDSRKSASEIARIVGANERTVRKRIYRMVNNGAIRLTAIVNPFEFGYVTAVDIFLEVEPEKEQQVIECLSNMQEISYLAFGQGTHDLSIEGRFKDNDDMREFLRKTLPEIEGVKVLGYALVPRILRNIDEWMPKLEDFETYSDQTQEMDE
jgi:Lrp/AsnC family transcriptional regulator, regulator for asnA, asnC and gidA